MELRISARSSKSFGNLDFIQLEKLCLLMGSDNQSNRAKVVLSDLLSVFDLSPAVPRRLLC
jgi:hypothetical protein